MKIVGLFFLILASGFAFSEVAVSGIDYYAANVICKKEKSQVENCVDSVARVVSHDTLYRYANLISGKDGHFPLWASYCKGTQSPSFCMHQFESDFDVFVKFVNEALDNDSYENRLLVCHKNIELDSFIFTRNKQCLYK